MKEMSVLLSGLSLEKILHIEDSLVSLSKCPQSSVWYCCKKFGTMGGFFEDDLGFAIFRAEFRLSPLQAVVYVNESDKQALEVFLAE